MTTTTAAEPPATVSVVRLTRWVEGVLVTVGAVLGSVLSNLSQVTGLTTTAPGDLGDPLYFAWQLAWVGHAVRTDPGGLWTTNAFQRAPDNLAFTDTVLGYLPLSFLVPDGQAGALALLNLATLTSMAMAIGGAYLLARVLGARIPGALVAAAGFGWAPWRLTQIIHINVISTGGIAITLALLCYGHGWSLRRGWRPERIRPGWAFGGWVAAAGQLTFGFATGIWFSYMVGIVLLAFVVGWLVAGRRRVPLRALPVRLLAADGGGVLFFLISAYLLVRPYLRVVASHPEGQRTVRMLDLFSPPWYGLLTAPDSDVFWADRQVSWRAAVTWTPEMLMSPGILLLAMAMAGLFFSSWPVRRRLAVAAVTAVLVVLSMGTTFPGHGAWTYVPLYDHLPGWANLRTPGRLMIWVTIGLCVLAAGAISRICDELADEWERRRDEWPARALAGGDAGREADGGAGRAPGAAPGREHGYLSGRSRGAAAMVGAMLLVPSLAVVGEGLNTTPHWEVATSPIALATLPQPILLLPSEEVGDYHMMLWSTEGWPVIANGDSGFNAASQQALRDSVAAFPDAASLAAVRAHGIATVVVIRSRTGPGKWGEAADKSVVGLDLTRTDEGDAVVFDVR